MTRGNVHPEGFYAKYPEVTWDLAEERWLCTRFPNSRSDVLLVVCRTCGWTAPGETVLAKPERRQVAEFLAEAQHWYQCPGEPRMLLYWLSELAV